MKGRVVEVRSDTAALLPQPVFAAAVTALPLVSLDWVLTNPSGQLLLGQRMNAPARGWWFTPGGRIRKNEALAHAMQRVASDELGLEPQIAGLWASRAQLMGAWDHFYPDSAFSPQVSTHYVNLPHRLALTWTDLTQLELPVGEQHSAWQWLALADVVRNPLVHEHVRGVVA